MGSDGAGRGGCAVTARLNGWSVGEFGGGYTCETTRFQGGPFPSVTLVSIQPITGHASTITSLGAGTLNGMPPARTSRRRSCHVARQQARKDEDREVRENRQPLERARDGEHEHDRALHEDRDDRRSMDGMEAGDADGRKPSRANAKSVRGVARIIAPACPSIETTAPMSSRCLAHPPSATPAASASGAAFEVASAGPSTPCATNCKAA